MAGNATGGLGEGGAGSGYGERPTSVEVAFCPNGEKAKSAQHCTKFHVLPTTTFDDLRLAACTFYDNAFEGMLDDMVLRNEHGAVWPVKRLVADELAHGGDIRLTPRDKGDSDDGEEVAEEEEEEVEAALDDGRVASARPPLYSELFKHLLFLLVLLWDTYQQEPEMVLVNDALEVAFTRARNYEETPQISVLPQVFETSLPHSRDGESDGLPSQYGFSELRLRKPDRAFDAISDRTEACEWLTDRFIRGLYMNDLVDGWGTIKNFNRVVGGVHIDATYEPWRSSFAANQSRYVYGPLQFPWGYPPATTHQTKIMPTSIELSGGAKASVIRVASLVKGIAPYCLQTAAEAGAGEASSSDAQVEASIKTSGTMPSQPQRTALRRLSTKLVLHNQNENRYILASFTFDFQPSGGLRPLYSFRPFAGEGSLGAEWSVYMLTRVSLWLLAVNWFLVALRTGGEFKACAKVQAETGSVLPYFSSVFTLLELFNLCCNYGGFYLRISQLSLPGRDSLADPETFPLDISHSIEAMAEYHGLLLALRALSILSAVLLVFKYLELVPRRLGESCYVTGTTLARAGRALQALFISFLVVLVAFAIVGEQLFGAENQEFHSVAWSFFSLLRCVAGSGFIYRQIVRTNPVTGPLFFVVFTLTHLIMVTPLFLAVINDAYAVRWEQMKLVAERRAARAASKANKS